MSEPQDSPSIAELLESVREFLERDVVSQTQGRVKFHARVAANVLGIVMRELELGPAQTVVHLERLRSLGVASEEELSRAIRSGALDDRLDEVREVVRRTVTDKLSVAHPRYTESGPVA
jgi:hypothetical protein